MKPQRRIKSVEEVPLSPYEQAIEDVVPTGNMPQSDPALLAEARAGMQRLASSMRGGKRPGSGRKPRETRRTVVLLAPAVRERLEELAKVSGSLSAAVEKAIMAIPR